MEIFFSTVSYDDKVHNDTESLSVSEIKSTPKLLLAGIANPKPFFDFLQADTDDTSQRRTGRSQIMTFSDHHHFSESEIADIKNKANDRIIVTTEKDFVRLDAKILKRQLFYLPIKSKLVSNQETFDQTILNYVGTCTRNR